MACTTTRLDEAQPSAIWASPGEGRGSCRDSQHWDLQFWHAGRIGPMIVEDKHVLDHESAGEVIAIHPSVTHLKPGDRVLSSLRSRATPAPRAL
ncbi:hypothetical protein EDB83DRAFT_2375194 [Lactarius deliciosus]|nr:hypothetical protein EDB83DRAFT_2375194 [Lactarius deliciosus]